MRQRLHQTTALLVNIILAAASTLQSLYPLSHDSISYHTSILSGEAWVLELMRGYPKWIYCELGIHLHIFQALLSELRSMGYRDSRFVMLEEQLAIFLYCCVTGLTIWHVGEWFQRSNGTISW